MGTAARDMPKKPANPSSGKSQWWIALAAVLFAGAWAAVHLRGDMALSDSSRKLAAEDTAGAVASARTAVALLPGNSDALYQLGISLSHAHDHAGAIDALRRAHIADPTRRDIFLAECRENLFGPLNSAIVDELTEYVNAHQEDAEAALRLGQTYERMRSTPDNARTAQSLEQRAQQLDPGDEEIAATLGARFVSGNRPADALQCYLPGLEKHPDSSTLLRGALLCYDEFGQTAKAADISARLASAPNNALEIPPFGPEAPFVKSTGPQNTPARFVDVAAAAGLAHNFLMVESRPQNILQTIGSGCAFLDYDNDGNLDILLVDHTLTLYRGDGHGHFTDVTHQTGLDKIHGYFLGCAVGDYDNDGYDDILLTGYNTVALLHNDRGRGFTDVTAGSGLQTSGWNTSAAWADFDNDGKLDLYICRYANFPPGDMGLCVMANTLIGCGPYKFAPERGVLYRNLGNGKFADVTRQWGVDTSNGRSLGVGFADLDGSGRQSLYITNDQLPSNLYLNTGVSFRDISRSSGASVREDGKGFSGMGVDWGDYDNDGKLDVSAMAYSAEDKRVLHNEGGGVFTQQYDKLGMHGGSEPWVAFGMKWFDYDNDGWLDMIYSAGPTDDTLATLQPTMLYHNERGVRFTDSSAGLIGPARRPLEGRGLAIGDYDNDGLPDVLIVDSNGSPLLLHNQTEKPGHWLDIDLIGVKSNRDGYGAEITAAAGGLRQVRVCHSDGSYLSSSDKRVHFGIGDAKSIDTLVVRWPSGQVDKLSHVAVDRVITVVEGKGLRR